jgi:hypothetical protein
MATLPKRKGLRLPPADQKLVEDLAQFLRSHGVVCSLSAMADLLGQMVAYRCAAPARRDVLAAITAQVEQSAALHGNPAGQA